MTSNILKFLVFGGGGKVGLKFAEHAARHQHQVTSVVRDDSHNGDITKVGAEPHILSLEQASVQDLADLMTYKKPDVVIFSAGAGGKGGEERTKAVDYEGAIKVFDACEASNTARVIVVSATDLRSVHDDYPDYYNDDSKALSDRMYKAIPAYLKYKFLADKNLHERKNLKFGIVRPGGLTDAPAGGVQLGKVQLGSISRESVAKLILAMAENPASAGWTVDVMNGDEPDVGKALEGVIAAGEDTWHD